MGKHENETINEKKANKKAKVQFEHKDYVCMVEVEEAVEKPVVERGRIVSRKIPTGKMIEVEKFRPDFISENGNIDLAKCRYRAAKFFGVSVDKLKEAYRFLNGKKLDGFYVSELIDRFGFSGGARKSFNRSSLAEKYKNKTVYSVDVAQDKLKEILNAKDVLKSYMEHVKDVKDEFEAKLKEETVYGQ